MKLKRWNKLPEHWENIDAPVFIWMKIHETNDLSWLLKEKKKINEAETKKLSEIWEKIYDEFISTFGFSDSFQAIIKKRIYIAHRKLKMIIENDRTYLPFINKAKDELAELMKRVGNNKGDFMKTKVAIESKLKFQIDLHKTSIREYYSYLQSLK